MEQNLVHIQRRPCVKQPSLRCKSGETQQNKCTEQNQKNDMNQFAQSTLFNFRFLWHECFPPQSRKNAQLTENNHDAESMIHSQVFQISGQ